MKKTILFYGKRNVGVNALMFLVAKGYNVKVSNESDIDVMWMAQTLGLNQVSMDLCLLTGTYDLFLCVHGTVIIEEHLIRKDKLLVNIHPCLFKYKGADPIYKYLQNKDTEASVESHHIIKEVDEGLVIHQQFFHTGECHSYQEFYDQAFMEYHICIDETLKKLGI